MNERETKSNGKARVAILGYGTVGISVAKALQMLGLPSIELSQIFNRDVARKQALPEARFAGFDTVWTGSVDEALGSDATIVVELIGGVDPARDWIRRALTAGKSVVTANKQLIAYHGVELLALAEANGVQLLYGAAVAGGVPVIPGIMQGQSGDRITRISGLLNGTCNYILSRMEAGDRYADVLADAQRLGYAESDPTADVGGFDARAKLCILSRVAMHVELNPDEVGTQTIADVDAVDFAYARELGCTIRQVSRAQREGGGMYARVGPMLVPRESPIAWSHGTQNMVVTTGTLGGDVVFSGHGAGGDATAVAVVSDIVAAAQGSRPVSLPVIVSAIAGALAQVDANIDSLLQRPGYPKHRLAFVVTTEPCRTSTIERAVTEMAKLDCMLARPLALQRLVVDDKDEETA
jgi:homoserine dehydrogenase